MVTSWLSSIPTVSHRFVGIDSLRVTGSRSQLEQHMGQGLDEVPEHVGRHVAFADGWGSEEGLAGYGHARRSVDASELHPEAESVDPLIGSAFNPASVKALYGVPAGARSLNPLNKQAVGVFGSAFDPVALAAFQTTQGLRQHNVSRHFNAKAEPFLRDLEANLNVQYLMGMADGAETWFFQQGGEDWLLALLDAVDSVDTPPWVLSITYGWPERAQCDTRDLGGPRAECRRLSYSSAEYVKRVNTLFQKLGSRGVSVIVSSGDRGAGGYSSNCPLRKGKDNLCPQIRMVFNDLSCNFPEGCTALLREPDCLRVLDKAKAAAALRGCAVSFDPGSPGRTPFFSSSCSCTDMFTGPPMQEDRCALQPYFFDRSAAAGGKEPFEPTFPASSPYVTAVGATAPMQKPSPVCGDKDVLCAGGERAASSDLGMEATSGGGFSIYSETPAYQQAAVARYLSAYASELPPAAFYSPGKRGYPDVAAVGAGCEMAATGSTGELSRVDGTSCSAPIVAGIVSLVNSQLLDRGKAPMGFLNPLLYRMAADHPEAFNDVTVGVNACLDDRRKCCEHGWPAKKGWDPVTGLGTINYPFFLSYVLNIAPRANDLGHLAGDKKDPYLTVPIVVGVALMCLFVAALPGACFGLLPMGDLLRKLGATHSAKVSAAALRREEREAERARKEAEREAKRAAGDGPMAPVILFFQKAGRAIAAAGAAVAAALWSVWDRVAGMATGTKYPERKERRQKRREEKAAAKGRGQGQAILDGGETGEAGGAGEATAADGSAPQQRRGGSRRDEPGQDGPGIMSTLASAFSELTSSGPPAREYTRKRKERRIRVEEFAENDDEDDEDEGRSSFKTPATAANL